MHYIQRVGLDTIKKQLVEDAANRKALYERLVFALQDEKDPWVERIKGAAAHEFEELSV